jgi:hypothetical protein
VREALDIMQTFQNYVENIRETDNQSCETTQDQNYPISDGTFNTIEVECKDKLATASEIDICSYQEEVESVFTIGVSDKTSQKEDQVTNENTAILDNTLITQESLVI